MLAPEWNLGFSSLEKETDIEALPVSGEIPPWLRGRLVRTGPAKFEVGPDRYRHWFDGLAMLHRFNFKNGQVGYRNRFLATATYRDASAHNRIRHGEFATAGGFLERLRASLGTVQQSDNGNVNVMQCAGKWAALSETPMLATFDPDSLATCTTERHPREIEGQVRTAHPLADPSRSTLYNYIIRFGRKSIYQVYGTDLASGASRVISTLPAPEPSYMHSFAMTERHFVLIETPFIVSPIRLALSSTPYIENFRWRSDRPTRFTVIDKDTGQVVTTREDEPFFFFHAVNAFEEDGVLTIDIIEHPSPQVIDELYLDRLRGSRPTTPRGGQLRRYRFELRRPAGRAESRDLAPGTKIELPRIHDGYARRSYRYVYGNGSDGDFFGSVVKVDIKTGETLRWFEEGAYAGEPVFVPEHRGTGGAEDDGVLLTLVLEGAAKRSFLQILDAGTLRPLARCPLPHHVPFGFHGDFFAEPETPRGEN